jgi:hypothetical protein
MDIEPKTACHIICDNKLTPLNTTMGDEMRRLETFRHWPKPHIVSPQSLAQAGFYYVNHDDRVQCAFCLGNIYNWRQGDNAMEEHRRLRPNCSFIKRVANRYKCINCLHAEVEVAFIPCLHVNSCQKCSEIMTNCVVCNEGIKSTLKLRFCHEKETFPSSVEQCDSAHHLTV